MARENGGFHGAYFTLLIGVIYNIYNSTYNDGLLTAHLCRVVVFHHPIEK